MTTGMNRAPISGSASQRAKTRSPPLVLPQAVPPKATDTCSVSAVVPPCKPRYEERWEIVNREGGRIRIGQVLFLSVVVHVHPSVGSTGRR